MKLKQTAKGPQVPMEERLYVFVEVEGSRNPFYFSKTWTFGKCLDFVLETLGLRNENNKMTGKKNVICFGEETLEFHETVGESSLKQGDQLNVRFID